MPSKWRYARPACVFAFYIMLLMNAYFFDRFSHTHFRDFRGARVSTLTLRVLKPNADPVVII